MSPIVILVFLPLLLSAAGVVSFFAGLYCRSPWLLWGGLIVAIGCGWFGVDMARAFNSDI